MAALAPVGTLALRLVALLLLVPLAGCAAPADEPGAARPADADARSVAAETARFLDDAEAAVTAFLAGESNQRMTMQRLSWDMRTFLSLSRSEKDLAAPAAASPARERLADAIGLGAYATQEGQECVRDEELNGCRRVRETLDRARRTLDASGLLAP